jgi:hypothetical protein
MYLTQKQTKKKSYIARYVSSLKALAGVPIQMVLKLIHILHVL